MRAEEQPGRRRGAVRGSDDHVGGGEDGVGLRGHGEADALAQRGAQRRGRRAPAVATRRTASHAGAGSSRRRPRRTTRGGRALLLVEEDDPQRAGRAGPRARSRRRRAHDPVVGRERSAHQLGRRREARGPRRPGARRRAPRSAARPASDAAARPGRGTCRRSARASGAARRDATLGANGSWTWHEVEGRRASSRSSIVRATSIGSAARPRPACGRPTRAPRRRRGTPDLARRRATSPRAHARGARRARARPSATARRRARGARGAASSSADAAHVGVDLVLASHGYGVTWAIAQRVGGPIRRQHRRLGAARGARAAPVRSVRRRAQPSAPRRPWPSCPGPCPRTWR